MTYDSRGSGTPGASAGGDPAASLQRSADSLSADLAALQRAQAKSRKQVTLLAVVIVIEALAFAWASWTNIRSGFEGPRLQAAMQANLQGLMQDVQPRLRQVAEDVAPTYGEAALAHFTVIRPQLEKEFLTSCDSVQKDVTAAGRTKMQDNLEQVVKRLEPDLITSVNGVANATNTQIIDAFQKKVDEQNVETSTRIDKMFHDELYKLEQGMNAIDSSKQAAMDKVDLEWQFVNLLVKLVDQKMSESAPKGATTQQTALAN